MPRTQIEATLGLAFSCNLGCMHMFQVSALPWFTALLYFSSPIVFECVDVSTFCYTLLLSYHVNTS